MNKMVGSVFIGAMLALFLVGSAASVPRGKNEQTDAHLAKSTAADHDSSQPLLAGYRSPLAHIGRIPVSIRIPSGVGTVLAGACLLLPFGLSSWATLRKRP
jgi:hypothetical protein